MSVVARQDLDWPDSMLIAIDAVSAAVDVDHVGARVPDPRPDRMVRIRRIGGARTADYLDVSLLAVECFGSDEEDAWSIASMTRDVLRRLVGAHEGGTVTAARETVGPSLLPDGDTGEPRYLMTVAVTTKARVAAGSS